MREYWMPLLLGEKDPVIVDQRENTILAGILQTIANNAEPIKLVVYLTPVIVFTLWISGLYLQAAAQRNAAMISRSRLLAGLSQEQTNRGNSRLGMLLAQEGLPDPVARPTQPYVVESDIALYDALSHHNWIRELPRHKDRVTAVQFSPDGKRVITASWDNSAVLWDVPGDKMIARLPHDQNVQYAAFSNDNKLVVTCGKTGTVWLWDADTGAAIHTLEGHRAAVNHAAFASHNKTLVTSSVDGTIRLWDLDHLGTVHPIQIIEGNPYPSQGPGKAVFNQDGGRLLVLADDGIARTVDVKTAQVLKTFKAGGIMLSDGTFGPDADRIFVVSVSVADPPYDSYMTVWKQNTGKLLSTIRGLGPGIPILAEHPLLGVMVTGGSDGVLRFWNTKTYQSLGSINHGAEITALAFSKPLGHDLLVGDRTGAVTTYVGLRNRRPMIPHSGPVTSLSVASDGHAAASASEDGSVVLFNENGDPVTLERRFAGEEAYAKYGLSPDGKFVVAVRADGSGEVWSHDTGTRTGAFKSPGGAAQRMLIRFARIDPSGSYVMVGLYDTVSYDEKDEKERQLAAERTEIAGTLVLRDIAGNVLASFGGHEASFAEAKFIEGGKTIVAQESGKLRFWDVATRQEKHLDTSEGGSASAIAIAPETNRLLTRNEDGSARLWDIASGKRLAIFPPISQSQTGSPCAGIANKWADTLTVLPPEAPLEGVQFSRDEKSILTAYRGGSACIWNADSGAPQVGIEGDGTFLETNGAPMALSPDGAQVLAVHSGGRILVWSAKSGTLIKQFTIGDKTQTWHAGYSPGGNLIFLGSVSKPLEVWDSQTLSFQMNFPSPVKDWSDVLFTADESRVFVLSKAGAVEEWRLFPSVEDELAFAKKHPVRPLSENEKVKFKLDEPGNQSHHNAQ
jgi:WD40 repeat protein